jgi:hypothetical protein
LSSALNALFAATHVPHFVPMHAGDIEQGEIDRWAAANRLVKAQQTVEMITVDGSTLYLGETRTAEENSVMDISIVRQNKDFDFLLDLDNDDHLSWFHHRLCCGRIFSRMISVIAVLIWHNATIKRLEALEG